MGARPCQVGSRQQDTAGIQESAEFINQLIELEIDSGIEPGNIVLAGFSQGGAVALYTALTTSHKIKGVMALSTYLPIQEITLDSLTEHGRQLPIFMAHGQHDDIIQIQHAQQSHQILTDNGVAVEWNDYPMAHSVNPQEIADIAAWLKRQLGM